MFIELTEIVSLTSGEKRVKIHVAVGKILIIFPPHDDSEGTMITLEHGCIQVAENIKDVLGRISAITGRY